MRICLDRVPLCAKACPQRWHLKGLILKCTAFMCWVRSYLRLNSILQIEQTALFARSCCSSTFKYLESRRGHDSSMCALPAGEGRGSTLRITKVPSSGWETVGLDSTVAQKSLRCWFPLRTGSREPCRDGGLSCAERRWKKEEVVISYWLKGTGRSWGLETRNQLPNPILVGIRGFISRGPVRKEGGSVGSALVGEGGRNQDYTLEECYL